MLVAAGVGLLCSGAPVSADVAYETKIVGTDDPDLSDLLDDVSQRLTTRHPTFIIYLACIAWK